MATKVKPSRIQITGTPQAGDVPVYVDQNTFQWGTGGGNGDVTGPASATDGHLAVFDGATGKIIKDGGAPTPVIDNLNSTSATSSLSANQGKVLNDKIDDLFGLGKFLSTWDATTGLPDSFPLSTPYTYSTGDYFLVETISIATPPVNYRPNGSSYTGTASTTTESDELEVGDVYIYDGSAWLLQSNHGKTVAFANIAGQPSDNANLATALNAKANDNAVVHLAGAETISGAKTLASSAIPTAGDDSGLVPSTSWVQGELAYKQDELQSGVNIRTINGTSILGSGNIDTPTGIPSQTGEAGKFLTTDGTSASWANVDALPSQTGQSGKYLTTDGTTASWGTVSGGITNDTTGTTTTVTKIWAGTGAEYSSLASKDEDVIYFTY